MRIILYTLLLVSYALGLAAQPITPIDKKATKETRMLYQRLKELSGKAILFGHQDDLAYGVGWKSVKGNSDVKLTTGSYPAVFGWDLGGIETGGKMTIDSVPFDQLRQHVIDAYKMGGVNTFSWHLANPTTGKSAWDDTKEPNKTVSQIIPGGTHHQNYVQYLDKVADFLLSLKTEKGIYVPIIFRPFHENNGNWFWWGEIHSTPQEYKALYTFTVDYLKNKRGLHHLLYAYSPDRKFETEAEFTLKYPGSKYVDIVALDDYYSMKDANFLKLQTTRLEIVSKFAKKENKLSAFSETGNETLNEKDWFTQKLLPCLKANEYTKQVSWVLVWRNAHTKHFYAPYPGHPATEDFKRFKQDPLIYFLDKLPALYK